MQRKLTGWALLAAAWGAFSVLGFATTINSQTALPGTITFTASNPTTSPTDAGNSAATVSFRTSAGVAGNAWNVQVQATTANFASCPSTLPASQVRVTCNSAVLGGGGAGGSAACAGAFNLSNALQTVASGTERTGTNRTYTVTLSFTFTDSWGYIATSSACTLGLSYTITAN